MKKVSRLEISSWPITAQEVYGFVGSCNGLICVSVKTANVYTRHYFSYRQEPEPEPAAVYIYNPITKEFTSLPGISIHKEKFDKNGGVHVVHGFGYHPQTDEYKVVRVLYFGLGDENSFKESHVEVYTLGSGCGWRYVGETSYFLRPNLGAGSICVNGALHWNLGGTPRIVVFDLADEKFHLLLGTPGMSFRGKLFVMKGCLCLGAACYGFAGRRYWEWDLWFLKKNEENSSNSCQEGEHYYSFWSWRKEFSTSGTKIFKKSYCEPFAITKKGEALLFANDLGEISLYNPETNTATPKRIRNFSEHCSRGMGMPIPHINSFVSLKALGEENVRTNIVDGRPA